MVSLVDNFLNNITMYRLVLYFLAALLVVAVFFSGLRILPFDPLSLIFSTLFLLAVCLLVNNLFAKVFGAVTNTESVYISALILALIITPRQFPGDLAFLGWVAVWAMASKYILALGRKHIFNPVAFAVTLTAITLNQSASWWVGTLPMLPFVLIGGVLIVRKIRRFDLVFSFIFTFTLVILGFSLLKGTDPLPTIQQVVGGSPLLFFAFVMLTEPLTTPPTKNLQASYGALVGLLFTPQIHLGSLYSTPEVALLLGNVFSYLVSPKEKLILKLKERIQIAPDIYDFIFEKGGKFSFVAGQFMEWTLGYASPDSRGNRRYFTLASSPSEDSLRLGIKYYENPSGFKRSLMSLNPGGEITASQLSGEFILPKDPGEKLVFIAGGIGITPFRSIIKYLLDTNQRRDIVLFYASKTARELVYTDIFERARHELGLKTVYVLSDTAQIPVGWQGRVGKIDGMVIAREVPDYQKRLFYLSGSHLMVTSFEKVLKEMRVQKTRIKTDYFPGFA